MLYQKRMGLMNDLTPNEYRKLLFLVTHADEEVIKLKLQNQLAILENREVPNK